MADRGIRIPLVADVAQFLRGMRSAEDALVDVTRDLDQLADRADASATSVANDFDTAFRRVRDDADQAADGIKTGGRFGTIGGEVADEFTENFGEAIRSGNPAGALLETFTSLGPALGVLGIGAAIGAGLINNALQGAREEAERRAEQFATLFQNMTGLTEQAGRSAWRAYAKGITDAATVDQRLVDALGVENIGEAYARLAEIQRQTGLSGETIFDAIAGTPQDAAAAQRRIDSALAAYQEVFTGIIRDTSLTTAERVKAQEALEDERDALYDLKVDNGEYLEDLREGNRLLRVRRDLYRDLNTETAPSTGFGMLPAGGLIP